MKLNLEIRPILVSLLRNKIGPLLVAIQIAISLAILVNAIYIVNLRLQVVARPSGITDEQNVFRLNVSNQKMGDHHDQLTMQKKETDIIRSVPGVISVARTNSTPLSQSGSMNSVAADRSQVNPTTNSAIYISPDSLVKTWGLKLIEGRDFASNEIAEIDQNADNEYPGIVIVSKALAQKLFPDQTHYVGKQFYFGTGEGAPSVRIIGVVDTLQSSGAQWGEDGEMSTLIPVRLTNDTYSGYTVRVAPGQIERVMRDAAEALRKASPTPINVISKKVSEFRNERYRSEKGMAWMLIVVSVLLVIVTASGIVGMSSLWVSQRVKQIGIRRALGARRVDILRYFISENILITTGGLAAGLLLALALNQLLVSQFELSHLPAIYLLLAPLVFWLLGIIAVLGPAWRAARVTPATATRSV